MTCAVNNTQPSVSLQLQEQTQSLNIHNNCTNTFAHKYRISEVWDKMYDAQYTFEIKDVGLMRDREDGGGT